MKTAEPTNVTDPSRIDLEVLDHTRKLFEAASQRAGELIGKAHPPCDAHERLRLLGEAAYVLRLLPVAERCLQASLELGYAPGVAARLALCAYRSGDLSRAEELIVRAMGTDPKGNLRAHGLEADVPFLSIYAVVLLAAGRASEALSAADQALKYAPNDPVAMAARADAAMLQGATADALRGYTAAIELSAGEVKADLLERRRLAEALSRAGTHGAPLIARSVVRAARHV